MVKLWFSCAWHGLDGAKYWFSCDSVVCVAWFRCGSDVCGPLCQGVAQLCVTVFRNGSVVCGMVQM